MNSFRIRPHTIWILILVIVAIVSANGQKIKPEETPGGKFGLTDLQAVSVPVIVENLSPGEIPVFSAAVGSSAVKVKRIYSPKSDKLKTIIINLSNKSAGELADYFDGLEKIENAVKPTWIEVGEKKTRKKIRNQETIRVSDFEFAVSRAETLFEQSKTARQSLLIITGEENILSSPKWKKLDPHLPSAQRAVTVVAVGAPTDSENGKFFYFKTNLNGQNIPAFHSENSAESQVRKWIGDMSNFYVISLDLPAEISSANFTIEVKAEVDKKLRAFQKRAVVFKPGAFRTELDEVLDYLSGMPDFNFLTAYKLPKDQIGDDNAVAPQIKDTVIRSGELNDRLQKPARKVFSAHKLENHLRATVFEHHAATVFTWKLISVSVSSKAMSVLSDDEITALIAHEVGHLYFARELAAARLSGNARASRIAELKCDIIALMTLKKLGLPSDNLISAILNLTAARTAAGIESISPESPAIEDRIGLSDYFAAKTKQEQQVNVRNKQ